MVITDALFKLVHTGTYPTPLPPRVTLVVATETEARTVSKRAVCMLLENCLIQISEDKGRRSWNEQYKNITPKVITLIFDPFVIRMI